MLLKLTPGKIIKQLTHIQIAPDFNDGVTDWEGKQWEERILFRRQLKSPTMSRAGAMAIERCVGRKGCCALKRTRNVMFRNDRYGPVQQVLLLNKQNLNFFCNMKKSPGIVLKFLWFLNNNRSKIDSSFDGCCIRWSMNSSQPIAVGARVSHIPSGPGRRKHGGRTPASTPYWGRALITRWAADGGTIWSVRQTSSSKIGLRFWFCRPADDFDRKLLPFATTWKRRTTEDMTRTWTRPRVEIRHRRNHRFEALQCHLIEIQTGRPPKLHSRNLASTDVTGEAPEICWTHFWTLFNQESITVILSPTVVFFICKPDLAERSNTHEVSSASRFWLCIRCYNAANNKLITARPEERVIVPSHSSAHDEQAVETAVAIRWGRQRAILAFGYEIYCSWFKK